MIAVPNAYSSSTSISCSFSGSDEAITHLLAIAANTASTTREVRSPESETDFLGFRMAGYFPVPEPGSIALLIVAAGRLLLWSLGRKR
jgi:hypothetical protein